MRMKLILTPLLLCASPAFAQQPPQVPPRIADPAVADRLANAAQAVSDALLNIPVGGSVTTNMLQVGSLNAAAGAVNLTGGSLTMTQAETTPDNAGGYLNSGWRAHVIRATVA